MYDELIAIVFGKEKNSDDFTATLEEKAKLFEQKGYKKTAREIIKMLNNLSKEYDKLFKSNYNIETETIDEHLSILDKQIEETAFELGEASKKADNQLQKEKLQQMIDIEKEKVDIEKEYKNIFALIIELCNEYLTNPNEELKQDIITNINFLIADYELNGSVQESNEQNDETLEDFKEETAEIVKESETNNKKLAARFVAGLVGISLLVSGIAACNTRDKKAKDDKNKTEVEDQFDYEANSSYQWFKDNGVRIEDAEYLTDNSIAINKILSDNNENDIKVAHIDQLLLDIYNGHNITSNAENYDSLDTFTSLENAGTVDAVNYILKADDVTTTELEQSANILEFASYLDVNQGSTFDKCMENLVKVAQSYYKDLNNEAKAQALIDTIYDVNMISGTLNAQEEGIITEFIMAVGPTPSLLFPNLKVSNTNITVDELIYNLVNEIEVFEGDCSYTRTLN